ncbi:unnamed protein product [Clonostachys solani]|uniref:Mitochondrial division protein 1 n=1 Tax=Clonostachys solani TaxID=160281 RepID=A0A9N9ZEC3_9HYPO|nr:unnamed protein product [Clonostachys solani]
MQATTTFLLDVGSHSMVYGFMLTRRFMIAAKKNCLVHSLQCQTCRENRGQICANHHAVLDTGTVVHADCYSESNLLLTSGELDDGSSKVGLWNLEDGALMRAFTGPTTSAGLVRFLNSDSKYASTSAEYDIMLWDRSQDGPTHVLRGHTDHIRTLELRDGFLFSGAADNTVRIWDLVSGACAQVFNLTDYISILTFSPDDALLRAGCGGSGNVSIWDWRAGTLVAERQTQARQTQLYTNFDGRMITSGLDGCVRIWEQDGTLLETFTAHDAPMRGLVKVGRFVVTIGTRDGRIKLWDWGSKTYLTDLQEPVGLIANVATGYGRLVVSSWKGSRELHQIQIWNLDEIERFASEYHLDH